MVSKDQWVDWKNHPVTQEYLKRILGSRESIKEGIAEGQSEDNEHLYIQIGRAQGMKDCFEYAIRDFEYVNLEEGNDTKSDLV